MKSLVIIFGIVSGIAAVVYLFKEYAYDWIKKMIMKRSKKWKGIKIDRSFFAWEGPNLHFLDEVPPRPPPPQLLNKLNSMGFTACYSRKDRREPHLAQGFLQVFETDRATYKKALLLDDGRQVMMIKPPKEKGPKGSETSEKPEKKKSAKQLSARALNAYLAGEPHKCSYCGYSFPIMPKLEEGKSHFVKEAICPKCGNADKVSRFYQG